MSHEQIEAFKAGLRKTESGSYDGNRNHNWRWSDGDGEVGAYGVRASNFAMWASELGYAGADWRDPEVMEVVVTGKINEYYQRYGDWKLVALAWMAGTELADAAVDEPTIGTKNTWMGETVDQLANNVMDAMQAAPEKYAGTAAPTDMPFTPGEQRTTKNLLGVEAATVDAKTQLLSLFESQGTDLAGGKRVDYRQIGAPSGTTETGE